MIRVLTPKRYLGRSKASRKGGLLASIFRLPGRWDGGCQEAATARLGHHVHLCVASALVMENTVR